MSLLDEYFDKGFDESWGIFFDDSILKKVFMTIFLSPRPIALPDIAVKTKLSLASVSNKASFLASIGIITKFRKDGSRKIFYQAQSDFVSIMCSEFQRKQDTLVRLKSNIDSFIDEQKGKKLSSEDMAAFDRIRLLSEQFGKVLQMYTKVVEALHE